MCFFIRRMRRIGPSLRPHSARSIWTKHSHVGSSMNPVERPSEAKSRPKLGTSNLTPDVSPDWLGI
ncbi:hypothetical protein P692DRAFT_201798566 [Suillus brevipes Sb2]|nr:hypothetical protein P692DRAFT_201798566 [Suillus brevipes Sb2]